jgi:hypothetical protein
MNSVYRQILKKAWSIAWKAKYLWFFGIFATLIGNGGSFDFGSSLDKVEGRGLWLEDMQGLVKNFNPMKFDWGNLWQNFNVWTVVLMLVIVAAFIFLLWLSISSQGALVYGVKKEWDNRPVGFSETFKRGTSKFWPVFLLNILLGLVISVALFILSVPFVALFFVFHGQAWQTIMVILAFIILIPVGIILSFVIKYAIIYAVNDGKKMGEAIQAGWQLFIKNWIVSIEMGVILFFISVIASIALVLAILLLAIPFVLLAVIVGYVAQNVLLWVVVALGIIAVIAVALFYAAVMNVFKTAAWVLLFEKLKVGPVYSKVLRMGMWLTGGKEVK